MLVDKPRKFCKRSIKPWLQDYDLEMYLTYNEGKSVVAETFIRTLKIKIYKDLNLISKNVYIDKIDDIVNECGVTYDRPCKMKPTYVKYGTYIDFGVKNNDKDPKFEVGKHVRRSKYKTISAKAYTPNCSKEVFVIKKVTNTVPWTYVIENLNGEEIVEIFSEKKKIIIIIK